jgi:hypothetical protein
METHTHSENAKQLRSLGYENMQNQTIENNLKRYPIAVLRLLTSHLAGRPGT